LDSASSSPSPPAPSHCHFRPPLPAGRAAATDVTVELSPFVLTESSETGWGATGTLAGRRLLTNFNDVPNQIETLTKDFMAEMAMNTIEQVAISTANTENSNDFVT
jgi:hypothetical protein